VVWVTVAIFVVSRVADNILVPRIMARSVGVSPIAVMFAVFAGGELFGLPGLILGIPAAALLKVLFGYFVQPYIVRMQTSPDADGEVHVAVDAAPSEAVVVTVAPAPTQERPAV
jgi:predicted PurR-regulated permease PerM